MTEDLFAAAWRKSSFSGSDHNCVEVAFLDGGAVAVRNSKRPDAGVAMFAPGEWDAFIGGVKLGEFDRI
jgi:hypothetical protein